jgi:signal peptidase I
VLLSPAVDRAKFMKEVRGWTLTILAVLAFRAFLFEAVTIPTGSMIPTLQIGDYVIVQKWAYGARIPFTDEAQVMWSSPRRGDIVVLLAPKVSTRKDDLIKRVVAVAGDTIELRDGHLVVNGKPVPRERVSDSCTYWSRPEGGEWREEPCVDTVEELSGHHFHTYCTPDMPCGSWPPPNEDGKVEPERVPEGMVWLAGDHRDNSQDSRYFGPQPVNRIKGRAWVALVSWGPSGPRWNRLFQRVNR